MKERITFVLLCISIIAYSQAKKRKLPRNINMNGYDSYSPAVSGDGKSMVYISNYTNEGTTTMMYTTKINASAWKDPEDMPRYINIPRLTYTSGYGLNHDGSEFYFTFKKSGGLGGYDIWMSKWQGDRWSAGQNIGTPINSSKHDGAPSISADGTTMYFMSCEQMTNTEASGCQLMVATRLNSRSKWRKPEPLPSHINTSNALLPKILADGETLMYMSDMSGSMQWYMTRKEMDSWTEPQKMDFLDASLLHNISIPAKGRYVFHDIAGERGRIIQKIIIPDEFKPKDVLRLYGKVNSLGEGTLKVYDINSRERIVFQKLTPGQKFDVVLKEGATYDVSFETTQVGVFAKSEILDLQEMKFSSRQKWDINIAELAVKDSLLLDVLYDSGSVQVSEQSVYELRRLGRFLSKNEKKYELSMIHYFQEPILLDTLATGSISEMAEVSDSMMYANDEILDTEADSTSVAVQVQEENISHEKMELKEIIPLETKLLEQRMESLRQELVKKRVSEENLITNGHTIILTDEISNMSKVNTTEVFLKRIN